MYAGCLCEQSPARSGLCLRLLSFAPSPKPKTPRRTGAVGDAIYQRPGTHPHLRSADHPRRLSPRASLRPSSVARQTDPIKNIVSLRLIDALIVGRLDLSECKDLPHLSFEDSVITGGIALRNARAGGIHLLRCSILRGIDASGLHSSAAIELKLVEFTHRTVLNFSEASIENGCSFSELTTVGSAKATETLQRDLDELVETLEAATAKAGNPTRVAHKFGAVPNPRHLVAKAWSTATALTPTGQLGDFAFISLKAAHIGGDLIIEGIRVSTATTGADQMAAATALTNIRRTRSSPSMPSVSKSKAT